MNSKEVPSGSRVERKKEETKQKIITIAMELFKEHGVDATTMEQIAREVDIAKGTLYNYFPVKEAIISEYIQLTFKEKNPERILQFSKLPDTRSRMILILSTLMEGVQEQKEIFEKYLVYQIQNMISVHRDAGMKSGIRLLAREIIVLGQKDGEIRSDLPLDILVALFEFAFVEVAQDFYLKPETFNASETIESCVDLFINGAKHEEV
ncbi:MAG: TetR/AcrR family transcriptional regulator [Firmicutes bacterium HGW-Firmicutes-15]|nr:MAG: TetR/AcrR family transcriptional regulator [Firmicutes bacterium HGW-Firmicutes-15]